MHVYCIEFILALSVCFELYPTLSHVATNTEVGSNVVSPVKDLISFVHLSKTQGSDVSLKYIPPTPLLTSASAQYGAMIGVPDVGNGDGQYPPKLPPTATYPLLYT